MVNDIIICPNCGEYVLIEQINCKIFRHGVYKKDNKQMDPHTSKEECDRLFREELIYGCGKPFRYDGHTLEICDYI